MRSGAPMAAPTRCSICGRQPSRRGRMPQCSVSHASRTRLQAASSSPMNRRSPSAAPRAGALPVGGRVRTGDAGWVGETAVRTCEDGRDPGGVRTAASAARAPSRRSATRRGPSQSSTEPGDARGDSPAPGHARRRADAQPLRAARAPALCGRAAAAAAGRCPTPPASTRWCSGCSTRGRDLPAALRVARQLVLERLAVLDIEQGASLDTVTARDDGAGRGHAGAARWRRPAPTPTPRHGAPRNADGRAHRLLDRRHGQARRARAQRLVRHRPDLRLRGRRPDRRRPRPVLSAHEYFTPRRQAPVRADRRHHRRRLRLPRRPGAAAERQLRPAGRSAWRCWRSTSWSRAASGSASPGSRAASSRRAPRSTAAARCSCARWSRPSSTAATSTTASSRACASCTARSATRPSAAPPAGPSAPTTSSSRAAASARSSSSCSCCWWCAAASSPRSAPARTLRGLQRAGRRAA